jgi:hypothetical protein
MKISSAINRFFNVAFILLSAFAVWTTLSSNAYAQYRDNLKECYVPWSPMFHKPTAIGNLGSIDTVVDLRGFVPMLLPSDPGPILRSINKYLLHWYRVPTVSALEMFYFGTLDLQQVIDGTTPSARWSAQTRFLKESEARGENATWVGLSYDLVKDSPRLYEQVVGGSGFKEAEPTTIFLSKESAFVVLDFKYSSIDRFGGDGQMLVALEFSRSTHRYKALYELYSTAEFNKGTREMFAQSAPYIAKALAAAF